MEKRPLDELHAQLATLPGKDLVDMIIKLRDDDPDSFSKIRAMLAARSVAASEQVDRVTIRKQA